MDIRELRDLWVAHAPALHSTRLPMGYRETEREILVTKVGQYLNIMVTEMEEIDTQRRMIARMEDGG